MCSTPAVVVTTIQAPTPAMREVLAAVKKNRLQLVVVGDRKTPDVVWDEPTAFLPLGSQSSLGFALAHKLPINHYARKNIGYLYAIQAGSSAIYDTDDDNAPLSDWAPRSQEIHASRVGKSGWLNAYKYFGGEDTWPRGLPLENVRDSFNPERPIPEMIRAPIQQGLANGSPDVDAVWRLIADRNVEFRDDGAISLAPGTWCPFNSQSTWWFPEAYPLLYLPSYVSFRMTDIWRSFVAQRCLWAYGRTVVFTGPEVFQDRNKHNLLRDFEQEIPGYLQNERIRSVLEALHLDGAMDAMHENMRRCYRELVAIGAVEPKELDLLEAWLVDIELVSKRKLTA